MININFIENNNESSNAYVEQVKAEIRKSFPGRNVEFEEKDVIKNNGVTLRGLTVQLDGSGICPTVYPYEAEKAGAPAFKVAETAIQAIGKSAQAKDITENFREENIFPRLVNAGKNGSDIYVTKDKELAVELYIRACSFGSETGWIKVTDEIIKRMGITWDTAYMAALRNLRARDAVIKDLNGMIMELLDPDDPELAEIIGTDTGMFVLTNSDRFYGASVILSRDVRERIVKKLGACYLLPSSVHEWIIIPVSAGEDPEELQELVQAVNATSVAAEDFLSDTVYYLESAEMIRPAYDKAA